MSGRGQQVMDTFVELADTLTRDYDVGDFLHLLVSRCEAILEVDTAGVMLETPEGELRLAAASSPEMEEFEHAEMTFDEGPCLDSYRSGGQVIAEDLREDDRWPNTAPLAIEMGLLSAYAFPLRLRARCIGALNLYRGEPGPFDTEDVQLAQAFADIAAIGILQERKVAEGELLAARLQQALDSRILIEQAKGAVHERHGVDVAEAFQLLRAESRNTNRKLRVVCEAVIAGATIPGPVRR